MIQAQFAFHHPDDRIIVYDGERPSEVLAVAPYGMQREVVLDAVHESDPAKQNWMIRGEPVYCDGGSHITWTLKVAPSAQA